MTTTTAMDRARRLRRHALAATPLRGLAFAVWAFALAALAGCAAPERRAAEPFEQSAWEYGGRPGHKLVTRHYEVYTTVRDEALVRAFPGIIESAFEEYARLVPAARDPHARMPVYLFATRGEWSEFTRRFAGPRAAIFLQIRNGGYCERGVSVIQYVAHQTTFPILAHEGLHQYLHHYVNPGVPSWLNEGLATLCEGQRWESYESVEFDARYNPIRRNALAEAAAQRRLMPLTELISTNPGRVVRGTSRQVATYYAQLWALLLFLSDGADGRYADGLQRCLNQLGSADFATLIRRGEGDEGGPGEALFRTFIAEDVSTVDREYRAFIEQLLAP